MWHPHYGRGPIQPHGIVLGARRLLGYKLPRDIFVEHAADQGVIGHSLSGSTVLEGLEVHLRESNGQALRFRQCLAGRLLQESFVRDWAWRRCELARLNSLEQLAF